MAQTQDYKERIKERATEEKAATRFDYDTTAFMLKEPCGGRAVGGPRRLRDRGDHRKLLEEAKNRQLYVWYGAVVKRRSSHYVVPPHLIDWDSVPDVPYGKAVEQSDLKCPRCGKKCSSTSGLTLHMKSHEDEDKEADVGDALVCRKCGKRCSSTSGYTLHMKSHGSGYQP